MFGDESDANPGPGEGGAGEWNYDSLMFPPAHGVGGEHKRGKNVRSEKVGQEESIRGAWSDGDMLKTLLSMEGCSEENQMSRGENSSSSVAFVESQLGGKQKEHWNRSERPEI